MKQPQHRRPLTSLSAACWSVAIAAPLLAFSTALAQDVLLTPEHVTNLRSATSCEISPDGKRIAYTLSVPRVPFKDDDGGAWSELHVVGADGKSRPYITGEVNVGSVVWKPGGGAISFLAKRGKDEHRSLYVIPIDGGEARNVLSFKTDISSYSWSPDGKRVAFIASEEPDKDRKKLKDKGFKQEIYEEEFTPVHVWIATPGKEDDEPRRLDLGGYPSQLRWSPVGTFIALALAPSPLIDDFYMKRKLHVFDTEDSSIVSSFQNPGKLGQVAWSPDGKRLAVISAEDINDPSAGRLMVASPDDGSLVDILPNYEGQVGHVAWQDADTIMYLGDEGVWTTFNEIRRDGSARKTHVPTGKMSSRTFTVSTDGQTVAMLVDSPTHPSEVFIMRHGDGGPKRLTNSNPSLADIRLAKQEVVRYKARDGLEIEGLLIHPLDEKPSTRYPLILSVHGGPEAHHRNGWLTRYSSPGQLAAARGFAVFYINYRGSTGRGVAFSKLGQADYAGGEFEDLIDGVDHLIDRGLVDKDKVGVTGGSYGGFATAWCSTFHSKRFAAGVMFVGISDHVSKAGTTDIPNEMTLVHARMHVWDDWDFFRERSPIYHVQKSETPLLIMHGKDDPRVHPSQSMELYRHLKVLNQTPVRLVWYPGEGHGNRKAAARFDYNLRMMRWFEHYLKGPGGSAPEYKLDYGPLAEEDDKTDDDDDS
ncbi:MAG: S9 family peptidase [Planctomycetes bacterium]|nr:S9 family peptidase [Planctomycetota bacterium]